MPGPLVAFQRAVCSTADTATPDPPDLGVTATGRRRYRQTKKYERPSWWRTRVDPFAEVWEVVQACLDADPTRTAKALFDELQAEHPGRFPDTQLRTLQRRVQHWRTTAILTFHDSWLAEDRLAEAPLVLAPGLGQGGGGAIINEAIVPPQYDSLMRQDGSHFKVSLNKGYC